MDQMNRIYRVQDVKRQAFEAALEELTFQFP